MDKQGFTKYLEAKNHSPLTIASNMEKINSFLNWLKKDDIQVTKPDILKYLEYLKNDRKQQNATRRNRLIVLNHYFSFLYQNEQIAVNPCLFLKIHGTNKKTLYKIYAPDELDGLFDNYYHIFVRNYEYSRIAANRREKAELGRERNALILSVFVYQGVRTGEIEKIKIDDVDLIKATIKIRGGKNHNERTLPLKASQVGLFINYLQKVRPQLLEYRTNESDKLFFPLPKIYANNTDNDMLKYVIKKTLTPQIKNIDKQFINFIQIRTSVITFWLKTHGLRKAQYFAGHRNISATEAYLPNNLDDLINDINKMHPFNF